MDDIIIAITVVFIMGTNKALNCYFIRYRPSFYGICGIIAPTFMFFPAIIGYPKVVKKGINLVAFFKAMY